MRSAIRSEQSKQQGLQYNQNKAKDGYIVSSTYVMTRDPSGKPDVQKFGVGR